MLIDIPYIHAFVKGSFVSHQDEPIECYLFAATLMANRPLLFTAHTKSGAVFSRLPIHAFTTKEKADTDFDNYELEPWGCVGNRGVAITHQYLKDYEVSLPKLGATGRYLFTIDQFDGAFSEDPSQHKTFNVIELYSGQIAAMPNNLCRFYDAHFTEMDNILYRGQTDYWTI